MAALLTIAKVWKEPKCPSTDGWIKKMWCMYIYIYIYIYIYTHTYNGILLGDQKEWNLAICNNMDGAREYNAKQNKSEKDKYHMISLICGI